ncbi:hypothetical protein OG401_10260 [Kitasatospora purpeofusca]|uniref:hypothetical protein n=1 Tax=Kitasatospora purpeofusca TaxID=67352 RepID=UPI00224F496F|nr:hypothetical protein [Kitasatospora purpeofusca]MCX4684687.1 hypothetical protein [Kitasatospora purpeofusca]
MREALAFTDRRIPHEAEYRRLEQEADRYLSGAEDGTADPHPSRWHECEYDMASAVLCPEADPLAEIDALMRELPGTSRPDRYRELLDLATGAASAGLKYMAGYTVERRSTPIEHCRWLGCREPLYAPGTARGAGNPRSYCYAHKKPRKACVKALQRRGIHIGRHRNLTYTFPGDEGQDLDEYRKEWMCFNLPRV